MLDDHLSDDTGAVDLPVAEHQSPPPPRRKADPPRINLGCALAAVVLPVLTVCLFVSWLFGYTDDAERFVRSFSFPAIQARYKPVADQLAVVTSDTLIDKSQSISNAVFMTRNDYTGTVLGYYKMVFVTNRSYDAVVGDYVRFLQSMPDWAIDKDTFYTSAENSENTEKVSITQADKSVGDRKKYSTIYVITLYFGDPDLWDG